jgi:hypothetical protein
LFDFNLPPFGKRQAQFFYLLNPFGLSVKKRFLWFYPTDKIEKSSQNHDCLPKGRQINYKLIAIAKELTELFFKCICICKKG